MSVIVRTKDRPTLLAEAFESLRAQTFRDFEVIVVVDGGADLEESRLDAGEGVPIRVVRPAPPGGRARALNAGLGAARGRFVGYLDDDDLWRPEHLETHVRFLSGDSPYRASHSDADRVFYRLGEDGRYHETGRAPMERRDFDAARLLYVNHVALITLVHERSAAEAAGGFDDAFDLYEDWEFLIRLSRVTRVRRLPVTTALYRIRDDGSNATTESPWLGAGSQAARRALFAKHWGARTPEDEIALLDGYDHAIRTRDAALEAACADRDRERSGHAATAAAFSAFREAAEASIAEWTRRAADLEGQTDRHNRMLAELERSVSYRLLKKWWRIKARLRG